MCATPVSRAVAPLRRAARASRFSALAAQQLRSQQAAREPHLHDLVGDNKQPGLLGGLGVQAVALRELSSGEIIFREKGGIFPHPSMHSIQISPTEHCQIDGEGRFTAHSFTPNTAVVVSPLARRPIEFVALRTIIKGEQLSFDYTTTEWELEDDGFVDATTGRPVRAASDAARRLLPHSGVRL